MNSATQTAKHLRDVYFDGNWTASNFKKQLEDVDWKQATTQIGSLNTIATLLFHSHYYVVAQLDVLRGKPLDAADHLSFDHPPITSHADWNTMKEKTWSDVEALASLIEQLPEEMMLKDFYDVKYGSYFRNLHGLIEHSHYHLGQIALLKKLVNEQH